MIEEWKDIPNHEGFYQVSNLGRVRRCYVLKPDITINKKTGYKVNRITIQKKKYTIHRLVAELFIDNPLCKEQVNHKDGNTLNNCVNNLEWVTPKENTQHALKTGLRKLKIPLNKYKYICNEYLKGRTMKDIAKEFNVQNNAIRDVLIKNKIDRRKKGTYERY